MSLTFRFDEFKARFSRLLTILIQDDQAISGQPAEPLSNLSRVCTAAGVTLSIQKV